MHSLVLVATLAETLNASLGAQSDTTRLRWVPNPRTAYGGWVSDPAHHLSSAIVYKIDSVVSALERSSSAEMAVVVIDSLDGLDPASAALLLHRRWGVGKAARDNGIVFLWSPALRKTQISVGYGLEGVLPDARTGRLLDENVIPAFRAGRFEDGLLAGVSALASAAREEKYIGPPRARIDKPARPHREFDRELIPQIMIFGGGIAAFFVIMIQSLWEDYKRRRRRRCPNGHGWLTRLSGKTDGALLSKEQLAEQLAGRVDYDIWVCASCDYKLVLAYDPPSKWSASGGSGGSSSSSSSSSSSGSSFGGGSAGGGGAGRSY